MPPSVPAPLLGEDVDEADGVVIRELGQQNQQCNIIYNMHICSLGQLHESILTLIICSIIQCLEDANLGNLANTYIAKGKKGKQKLKMLT